jgi:ATP-dependent protease ClpP protease subunit
LLVQYRERIMFLSKPIDDELGNQLVATMLYLDSENKKDISLYINCTGGEVRRASSLAPHGSIALKNVARAESIAQHAACLASVGRKNHEPMRVVHR